MEISRRKLAAIIGIVLILVMSISMFSSMTSFVPCRITMYADPALDISLGQFMECECINPFTSYDWDGVVEGEYYQCPVYVKNTGTVSLLITYLPTDLYFFDDEAHFIITCYVIEFGLPCELYPLDTPIQLPEKDPANCTSGFYLPPGKVVKVDIVLYIDRIVVGELYEWEFTFWGKVPCEAPRPAELVLDKFNDLNGNGIYDAGDGKIADWRIDLTDPHGATTTYLTPEVLGITDFGTYIITEDLPAEWEQTALRVDGDYITPPAATATVLINEGETHDVLYGNMLPTPTPAELVIDKFNDVDDDGFFDIGEPLIPDWTVYVTYPDGTKTPYSTPVTLSLTEFGTYIIEEDLPSDWMQTALRVDGDYKTPTVSWTMTINEGESHDVLYGNNLPAPRIEIHLWIEPYSVAAPGSSDISWEIVPGGTTPVRVTFRLYDPDGNLVHEIIDDVPPIDLTGSYTHSFTTADTGTWVVWLYYDYEYAGSPGQDFTGGTIYVY